MGKIDRIESRILEFKSDTNEKYQLEQTGTIRDAELAATLAALNKVLEIIKQESE